MRDTLDTLFPGWLSAIALLVGVLVAVVALVALLRRVLHGPARPEDRGKTRSEREADHVRRAYFEKERRMREIRARRRAQQRVFEGSETYAGESPRERRRRGPAPGRPADPEREHAEALGLSPPFTPEAIKRAFKARIGQYHPDRVAPLGEKLRLLAEEETKKINAAYRFFRDRYGF